METADHAMYLVYTAYLFGIFDDVADTGMGTAGDDE